VVTGPPKSKNHTLRAFLKMVTHHEGSHRLSRSRYIGRSTATTRGPCLHKFCTILAHHRCGHVITHIQKPPRHNFFYMLMHHQGGRRSSRPRYISHRTATLRGPYLQTFPTTPVTSPPLCHQVTWPPAYKNQTEHSFFNLITHYLIQTSGIWTPRACLRTKN